MKRILIILMALLSSAVQTSFITMESKKEDKSLESLWAEYAKAADQDRVRKMAGILEEIKAEALVERASWDYYRACRDHVEVMSRSNWKLRDSLQKQMRNEIMAYDDPLLIYLTDRDFLSREELLESLEEMRSRLRSERNVGVYKGRGDMLNGAVRPLIENDYEYALWDLFRLCIYGHGKPDVSARIYGLLKDEIADSYPKEGIADYYHLMHMAPESEKVAGYEALAARYEGRAMSLLPNQALTEIEFRKNRDTASSDYFIGLRKRLESYEHERRLYRSGSDKLIAEDCHGFSQLLEHLKSRSVLATVRNGKAELALRNLDKVKVSIVREDKKVFEIEVENQERSFYKLDTLAFELPALDDGDYRIICHDGNEEIGECHYPKFTLSLASMENDKGVGVYVADYLTGEPVLCVDMELYKGDRKVAEVTGVEMDGFTALPEEMVSILARSSSGHYLSCRYMGDDGKVRRSQNIYVSADTDFQAEVPSESFAAIMLDRAAFNPGEVVKFKAVVYGNSKDGALHVVPEGHEVIVWLRDSQGNVLAEKELSTNDYGSVAGEFVLDGIRRNGVHSISVRSGNRQLGSAALTVDEFVLPAFDVSFDRAEKAFLPGDVVEVRGKVASFSGHSVASARMLARVTLDGKLVMEEPLEIGHDGAFFLNFEDSAYEDSGSPYEIEVRVTDLTGETRSFYYCQHVLRHPIVRAEVKNPAEGSFSLKDGDYRTGVIVSDDVARISLDVLYPGAPDGLSSVPMKYSVLKNAEAVIEGETVSGSVVEVDFTGLPSGLYEIVAETEVTDALGRKLVGRDEEIIVKIGSNDGNLDGDFENMFHVTDEDVPELQIGAGCGPVWAVIELYGDRGQRLKSDIIHLGQGEMKTVRYDYRPDYPDALALDVLYFRNSRCYTYSHMWERPVKEEKLPLEFVSFEDVAAPGDSCSVLLKTRPGVELLASVFDVSTEELRRNEWRRIYGRKPSVAKVRMRGVAGMDGSGYPAMMGNPMDLYDSGFMFDGVALDENVVVGYGTKRRKSLLAGSMLAARSVNAESAPVTLAEEDDASADELRSEFSTSLAFEPFLYSSDDGTVKLDFKTSDKMSRFVVSVFAHDKSMNNNVIRRDMLVTMPVKVSVVQPQYLYEGDRYVLKASVSNNSASDISGKVALHGSAYGSCEVSVPAGGSVPVSFELSVPSGIDEMDFKIVFSGEDCTDGIHVSVPVCPASQELEEAHSAVLLYGMSEEHVLDLLRGRFVNVSSEGAEYSAVSVMDMLREALPLTVEAEGKDVVSQSEAMYVNLLAAGLRASEGYPVREYAEAAMSAVSRILACSNADGGFAWFEGMKSSPIVTAVVLERFAGLRDRRLLNIVSEEFGEDAMDEFDEAVVSAVRYLDSVCFSDPDRPLWYGCISLWQYLNVRSMYVGVPFDEAAARKAARGKVYDEFRNSVREYLVPGKGERWTDGAILSKVRMIRVIDALVSSGPGLDLSEAWGLPSEKKLRRSLAVELESLKEYAVSHPSGGVYYPNAVLPWRGLLESEAYAHAMICDLFKDLAYEGYGTDLEVLADGVRLWLMLQKETQQWGSDPGFVEAMASVYDASKAVKETKVIVLSKRYSKPFSEIKAAGNGFRVSVTYHVDESAEGEEVGLRPLSDGDVLHAGDRIIARYSVWSEENRSFVRLCVPRPACLRPENQLSGWAGGFFRPLSYGTYNVSPYAYREVKADKTLYWIDVFPEEESVIEEVLFVTQEGCFSSPATEIESLYAPHYRANGSFFGHFVSGK